MGSFFELAWDILPDLLEGAAITLQLTVLCLLFGSILGLLLALGRVWGNKPIYLLTTSFIELFRGTPLLVQLFIVYYGLPEIGILLDPFPSAIIAMSLNTSAYQAEYFRGAIQSIKAGQMMAARAIGMSRFQAIRYIILPQALRIVIPPWSNEVILMLLFSSLAFIVAVPELMARGRIIATRNFRYLEVFGLVAIIYLAITLTFTKLLDTLERKVRIPGLEMRK
jgi:polar amino acid transport system permease protein